MHPLGNVLAQLCRMEEQRIKCNEAILRVRSLFPSIVTSDTSYYSGFLLATPNAQPTTGLRFWMHLKVPAGYEMSALEVCYSNPARFTITRVKYASPLLLTSLDQINRNVTTWRHNNSHGTVFFHSNDSHFL